MIGLDADYQWTGIKGDNNVYNNVYQNGYDSFRGDEAGLQSKVSGFGTVRARLGYAF